MVESTALEMRHGGNSIGGSNPSLSAICFIGIKYLCAIELIHWVSLAQLSGYLQPRATFAALPEILLISFDRLRSSFQFR